MRRIVVLAGVTLALAGVLALHGTSVLPKLDSDRKTVTPLLRTTPTSSPSQSQSQDPSQVPPKAAEPGAPLPGTVLTARPESRRCPTPPCSR